MKSATVLALLLCGGASFATAPAGYSREPVSWTNGDVRLAGTLYLPSTPGRHPAAIFIHGSGNMGRGPDRGNEIFRVHAERLAASGIAMLLYDKRGVGESTGTWQGAPLETLAADAAAGLELLQRHPGVDPSRIGIFGLSQGSWVSLMALARTSAVSFVVWVTGAAVSPARQEEHVVAERVRAAGLEASSATAALDLLRETLSVYRTNSGWSELERHVKEASSTAWFKAARIGVAQPSDAWWRWYASFMDYDPRPALESLRVPLFAVFAGDDELVDSAESAEVLHGLAKARPITIATYPSIRHGLRDASRQLTVPDAYWRDLDRFLASAVRK